MHTQTSAGFDDLCRFAEQLIHQNPKRGPLGEASILSGARANGWIDQRGNITRDGQELLRAARGAHD